MKKFLYMVIDMRNKYELPLIVADNIREIAEYSGRSYNTVKSAIKRCQSGEKCGIRFIRVEIDDEGE